MLRSDSTTPVGLIRRRALDGAIEGRARANGRGHLPGGPYASLWLITCSKPLELLWYKRLPVAGFETSPISQCPAPIHSTTTVPRDWTKASVHKSHCKRCGREKSKRYYAANRERVLTRRARRTAELRESQPGPILRWRRSKWAAR